MIQLSAIPYMGVRTSNYDIEFTYNYNWDLTGTGGWYEDYKETFSAVGTYKVRFTGEIGQVVGSVSWKWTENDYDTELSSQDTYAFTYSLTNGSYLSGTDQDEIDTTGRNVWFHLPQGVSSQNYEILDAQYSKIGSSTFWAGPFWTTPLWEGGNVPLMPYSGVKLRSNGYFDRDDEYGEFTASYTSEYFFTPEGYLLGEIWSETDSGYDRATGYWSEFKIKSFVCVISANYMRSIDFFMYFLIYWSWIVIACIVVYLIYPKYRWRPKHLYHGKRVSTATSTIIERNLPKDAKFSISSAYAECFPSYITNANLQKKLVISAHIGTKVVGIGFIEQKKRVGTFFGECVEEMIKYGKVKYAFTDYRKFIWKLKQIEVYDVLKISDLQNKEFNYDPNLIKPAIDFYLPPIMKLIANEDYGKIRKKKAEWVKEAAKNDIIVVATVDESEIWISDRLRKKFFNRNARLERYLNKVVLGVGFTTPGEGSAWLYGLYVHPGFRNSGIGENLVMARLSMLKEIGCKNAITEIAEWNGPAKSIYKHLDAKFVGKLYLYGKKKPKVKVRRY